jgi:hypothetical protein
LKGAEDALSREEQDMRLTRWISLALAAVMALAVAGIAIAHGGGQAQKTEQVSATFTATPDPAKTKTRQCTGVDGTYAITKDVSNGDSTGDPRLTGKITIKAKTTVNTTTGLGWTEGTTAIKDATTGKLKSISRFSAVITDGSKIEGYAVGKVRNPPTTGTPKEGHGHGNKGRESVLLANFSATADPNGGLSGSVGGGDGNNTAIVHGNPCASPQHPAAPNDDNQGGRHENHGHHAGDDDHK